MRYLCGMPGSRYEKTILRRRYARNPCPGCPAKFRTSWKPSRLIALISLRRKGARETEPADMRLHAAARSLFFRLLRIGDHVAQNPEWFSLRVTIASRGPACERHLAGTRWLPPLGCPARLLWSGQLPTAREILMPDDASAAEEPAALAGRVRSALESGDLDAIRDLLGHSARWGAPEGPGHADCRNRDQVIAWWASARAAGARAVVTEVTAGPGTLLVGLDVSGTPTAREAGGTARPPAGQADVYPRPCRRHRT